MDIVKITFSNDGREDLVKLLSENDTRIIEVFLHNYGHQIPFPDDIRALLNFQMGNIFIEDMEKIIEIRPEIKSIFNRIKKDLSDDCVGFDNEIIDILASLYEEEDILENVMRCMKYYSSFFLDPDELYDSVSQ